MGNIVIPEGYHSSLSIKDTEKAIKRVKDFFERELATQLNLKRVSAPLFVFPESGLNDNLNGVERPVKFGIKELNDKEVEIIRCEKKFFQLNKKKFSEVGILKNLTLKEKIEEEDELRSNKFNSKKEKMIKGYNTQIEVINRYYAGVISNNLKNKIVFKFELKKIIVKRV